MSHHPEKDEVPDRIRRIILTRELSFDEREELDDWLADCTEAQFEEYLELTGLESPERDGAEVLEDEDDELY